MEKLTTPKQFKVKKQDSPKKRQNDETDRQKNNKKRKQTTDLVTPHRNLQNKKPVVEQTSSDSDEFSDNDLSQHTDQLLHHSKRLSDTVNVSEGRTRLPSVDSEESEDTSDAESSHEDFKSGTADGVDIKSSKKRVEKKVLKTKSVEKIRTASYKNMNIEKEENFEGDGNESGSEESNFNDVSDSYDEEEEEDEDNEEAEDCEQDDEEDEVEEAESEEDEYAAIKKELADMPLEDLMKLKEKVGLKVFNKIMHGDKFTRSPRQKDFKRANKNRPVEVSSKRPVPLLRNFSAPKDKVRRDPRFDDLSGEYSEQHFSRNFSFLSDVKGREKQIIEKKINKTTNEEKKAQLQQLLSRMNQQEKIEKSKKKKQELEAQWKQKEKALIKEGKTPYFLKKADKKKLELAEKYRELQKSGKVDQYLSKKRKKNAQKERKKLPNQHMKFD